MYAKGKKRFVHSGVRNAGLDFQPANHANGWVSRKYQTHDSQLQQHGKFVRNH